MNKVKVATIGYGHLGRWHAQKADVLEVADLVAIVEKSPLGQEKAKEAHPNVKVVSDVSDVINEIDAAVIVTPTSFHYELILQLLENDKHVFCEKPMTATYEQSLRIKEILESKKDLVFQVGHSERCHQVWDFKKDYLSFFKSPATVKINRFAPFKGRATDVDVVQDLMIHDIDLMLYLFEEMPIEVRSTGHKIRTDNWDHVSSDFIFENGRCVNITAGRNAVKEVREFEITADEGAICFDLFANKLLVALGSENEEFVKEVIYEKRDHLLVEQEKFYDSVLNHSDVFVDIQDGVNAMKLIDMVTKSLELKETIKIG